MKAPFSYYVFFMIARKGKKVKGETGEGTSLHVEEDAQRGKIGYL